MHHFKSTCSNSPTMLESYLPRCHKMASHHGAKSEEISIYLTDACDLYHQSSEVEYREMLQKIRQKWSAAFHEHYTYEIAPDITSIARWVIDSLEPRLSVPDFVSQLWRKIGAPSSQQYLCKRPKRHKVMGVALSRSTKISCPKIQLHMALLISETDEDGHKTVSWDLVQSKESSIKCVKKLSMKNLWWAIIRAFLEWSQTTRPQCCV